jgi:hypothetical protein
VGVLNFFITYVLPMAIMAYCYTKIAFTLRARVQPASQAGNTMSRARRNIIKTLVIVCICFVLCWTWNEVLYILFFLGYPVNFGSSFYHFTVVAVFCNSCINPFIYIIKYEQFQVGFKRLVCGLLRRDQVDESIGSQTGTTLNNAHSQGNTGNQHSIATVSR